MERRLWEVSRAVLPHRHVFDFNQALMDFGATLCTARKPKCLVVPAVEDVRVLPVEPGASLTLRPIVPRDEPDPCASVHDPRACRNTSMSLRQSHARGRGRTPVSSGDRRIGPYELRSLIGAGGMGEVYLARDTKLGRDVAIKMLPAGVAHDPERIRRFEREARTLASLNHPNIAHVYGVEDSGSDAALVMEYVEGPTLADRHARGPLALDDACRWRARSPRRSSTRTSAASCTAT